MQFATKRGPIPQCFSTFFYWNGTLWSVKIARGTLCNDTRFVLFQISRNIILLHFVNSYAQKTPVDTGVCVCVCNTAIVAYIKINS